MGILDLIRRKTSANTPTVEAETKAMSLVSVFGAAGGAAPPIYVSDRELFGTVAGACVGLIRDTIAAIPLRVHRRLPDGSSVPDHGHPLAARFRRPCAHLDGFAWTAALVEALLVDGESVHYVHRDQRGRVLELIPLPKPALHIGADGLPYWQIINALGDPVVGLRLRHLGVPDLVYDADILLIRAQPHSYAAIRGRAPAVDARGAVGVALAAERQAARMALTGARPGGIVEAAGKISRETVERFRAAWDKTYGGVDNTGKVMILPEGLGWKPMSLSSVDAQFLEQRRFQVEEICRFFRVPLSKPGVPGASPRANIEAEQQAFLSDCILPWLERIESAMDAKLLADDGYCVEFDTSQLLRGDSAARASYYTALRNSGALTINDIRRAEGLSPLDHPAADDPLAPLASNSTMDRGRPPSSGEPREC